MILKLNEIMDTPGGVVPFDYTTDFSDLDINFIFPFKNPVRIFGEVTNEAGIVRFHADCETVIQFDCMRCAECAEREWTLTVDAIVTENLENPDDINNADIIVIQKAELDADRVVRDWTVVESDMVFLCSDCEI